MDLAEKLNADLVVIGRAHAAESSNRMGEEKIFDADITAHRVMTCDSEPASGGQRKPGCRQRRSGGTG
ncbi:MAG: hypothetical protein U5K27_01790 [Desulfotignum sp.]|nr:hypothetical protein [Desulfotignum sp.]